MNASQKRYIGIDVAKDSLQIDQDQQRRRIANTPAAIRTWLDRLGDGDVQLICEPTGGYEREVVRAAHRQHIPISVVNARHVRAFARAHGLLEKTDKLDARVQRRFGEQVQPPPTPMARASLEHLRSWVAQRDHAVQSLRRESNRLEQERLPAIRTLIARTCRHFHNLIEHADKQIEELLQHDSDLLTRVQALCLVQAVHLRTATSLIAHMPELGTLSDAGAAKLAGLAPLPDDSGTFHGRRFIQHGRAPARRALYMAALVAARCNPFLRAFYLGLRSRGKPPKLAVIAVARKLLLFLNRILRDAPPLLL